MQVKLEAAKDDIRELRQDAYLGTCPIEEQLEALTEAAAGRPEKLNDLLNVIQTIKELYPYPSSEIILTKTQNKGDDTQCLQAQD